MTYYQLEEKVIGWWQFVVIWLLAVLLTSVVLGILVIGVPVFIAARVCFYLGRWLYRNITVWLLVIVLGLLGGAIGALVANWLYWYFIARMIDAMVH